MLGSPIVILDYDRFKNNNAILKFICSAADNQVRLGNFRINVDDYDDWDYKYDITIRDERDW
jgi:hypothetical protein